MITFYEVPQALLDDLWPAIVPLLKKATDLHPFITPALVRENTLRGHTAIIVGVSQGVIVAACALELLTFGEKRVANIYLFGAEVGFMKSVESFREFILTWARAHHCTRLMIMGRPGWLRVIKRFGAHHQHCVQGWTEI